MSFDWSKVGRTPPGALGEARTLAHHAAQWVARVAQANLRTKPDDSQASFSWDASHSALVSQPLPTKGGEVRIGLRISRLELILTRGASVVDAFQFDGKTEAEAGIWVDTKMHALSLNPATGATLGYALPAHPAGGGRHRLGMLGRELGELSRWFGGPAEILEDFREKLAALRPGPVRCWPHHFDIATLVRLDESSGESAPSVGVGASPGDEFYSQPYVYVSPSPRFEAAGLPELPRPGHWHTEGFFGAVAAADDILSMAERAQALQAFIEAAFAIGRARLGR
ncbi:MAG: hypothetical protein WBO23_14120 [Burkholderiales bacterium]